MNWKKSRHFFRYILNLKVAAFLIKWKNKKKKDSGFYYLFIFNSFFFGGLFFCILFCYYFLAGWALHSFIFCMTSPSMFYFCCKWLACLFADITPTGTYIFLHVSESATAPKYFLQSSLNIKHWFPFEVSIHVFQLILIYSYFCLVYLQTSTCLFVLSSQ